MSEYQQLRTEINELRKEIHEGFKNIEEWREKADVGMRGSDIDNVWGYKQKIDYNGKRIGDNNEAIKDIEMKVNKIIWTAIGAASVSGTGAAVIFNILQKILSG